MDDSSYPHDDGPPASKQPPATATTDNPLQQEVERLIAQVQGLLQVFTLPGPEPEAEPDPEETAQRRRRETQRFREKHESFRKRTNQRGSGWIRRLLT